LNSLSLPSMHTYYFGKDKYKQHDSKEDTLTALQVVQKNNVDISSTEKHFDYLISTQPKSDKDLSVKEYTFNQIKLKGKSLKSTTRSNRTKSAGGKEKDLAVNNLLLRE
jgi:hypothetical protein